MSDEIDFDNLTLAGLCKLLDVPFVFWTCPKGCRGMVEWNTDKTDAKCLVCDARRSDSPATEDRQCSS